MSSNKKPLLMLGLPTNGEHSYLFTQSLIGMAYPTNFGMEFRAVPGYEVGDARNILVQTAIDAGAKYLMFIDEDVIGLGNGIRQLIYRLETHPEWTCVGGVYSTKTIPPEPLIFTEWGQGPYWGWKRGELIRAKGSGSGFHCFRVKDLERMKLPQAYKIRRPWDGTVINVRQWFKTGKDYVKSPQGMTTLTAHTEDSWLYSMFEQEGLQLWIDTGVWCRHYDKNTGIVFEVPTDNDIAVMPEPWNHTPRIVNLGCGNLANQYEVNVDLGPNPLVNFRCDIRKLPDEWQDTFDVAKAYHVLEHFGYGETDDIVSEWVRILKPGGKLEIRVPNLEWVAGKILGETGGYLDVYLLGVLYGDQGHPFWRTDPYGGEAEGDEGQEQGLAYQKRWLPHSYANNHHKSGFTPASLGKVMNRAGLIDIEGQAKEYEIFISGIKPMGVDGDIQRWENEGGAGALQVGGTSGEVPHSPEAGENIQADGGRMGQSIEGEEIAEEIKETQAEES